MHAIQYRFSYLRYALGVSLGRLFPSISWSGLTTTVSRNVTPPDLPGPDWVRIRTRLGGICGTDLGAVYLHTSPYYSPLNSQHFTFGHENVGSIDKVGKHVREWETGERVVIEPTLWCAARGFSEEQWCEFCAIGEINRCLRYAEGDLAPGIITGTNGDTGGTWSESFVAHRSQLYKVPDGMSDENVLMSEPFACAVHAVLTDMPSDDETILIVGAGTIGLVTLAALRALGSKARILISARYEFQREAARKLGADEILSGSDLYLDVAELTDAALYKPPIGKRVVVGGADRVYECVGSDSTIDDSLRLTRNGGTVIIVGVPGVAKNVDWTAIYAQELRVIAADRYSHADTYLGKQVRTFDVALDLLASGKVDIGWMLSRRYPLAEYKRAFSELADKSKHPIIKAAFAFPD
jgi:threonine dehydrogenase-like Zn-dependent dehydrogenase